MAQDLTNLYISQSFQKLLQVSSSISQSISQSLSGSITQSFSSSYSSSYLADGTGSIIYDLEITSSWASNVVSSSYAATASVLLGSIESASYAVNAGTADFVTSASYAVTASYALNVTPHESASYAASASNADHADFADVATSATSSISSSFATNASTADSSTSASYAATASVLLGSIQSSSYSSNSSTSDLADLASTANTASYVLGASVDGKVALATLADTASLVYGFNVSGAVTSSLSASVATSATSATTATSASHAVQADSALASNTSISASHAVQANSALASDTSTSASHAVQADSALTSTTASFLPSDTRLNITDITASNASFTSASIGYLQSITGSAKIIGDAFIILNSGTPTERYAGIKVEDSGSATTASLQIDSQTNDWFYEYESGDPTDYGVVMFGPEFATKGSPTYLTSNTIPKGNGGHHLNDSSIVDNGVNVTTTLPISSSGGFIGDLTGNASTATTATSASHAVQADNSLTSVSASHALQADNSLTASYATYATASTSASHAVQADSALSANTATSATSASYAPTNVSDAHTWTNVNTFNSQVHGGVTALSITSNTASMDFQSGNFFTLTLVSGSATHLDATNTTAGQTITLKTLQPSTATNSYGTLTFATEFKFAGGAAPTVTAASGSTDVLTFVTTDSTDVFGTSLLNFS